MATGLFALLDDISALAKVAAATIDDAAGQAARAGVKAAGVVVDDTAVTPRYVVGFAAQRELPIVAKIAAGSLINKMLILLPAALLLSAYAPWVVMPLLMLGGAFLCYEGAHKLHEMLHPHAAAADPADERATAVNDPAEIKRREDAQVKGAIRTDFILSAEIMAITLGTVAAETTSVVNQAVVLGLVALAITAGVYGVVALIVKMDDIGVWLAGGKVAVLRPAGRGLVKGMPHLLNALGHLGTAAMLWVGGGIVVHGLESFGLTAIGHAFHDFAHRAGFGFAALEWLLGAGLSGLFGVLLGMPLVVLHGLWARRHGETEAGVPATMPEPETVVKPDGTIEFAIWRSDGFGGSSFALELVSGEMVPLKGIESGETEKVVEAAKAEIFGRLGAGVLRQASFRLVVDMNAL